MKPVYCHACSEAGGASKPIYHLPPACHMIISKKGLGKKFKRVVSGKRRIVSVDFSNVRYRRRTNSGTHWRGVDIKGMQDQDWCRDEDDATAPLHNFGWGNGS